MVPKFRRYILLIILAIALGIAGVVLLSPFWLPIAGSQAARAIGLEWESESVDGYSAVTLRQLRYRSPGVGIEIDRIRLPQPLALLKGRLIPGGESEVMVDRLTIVIRASEGGGEPGAALTETIEQVEEAVWQLMRWTPDIRIKQVEVFGESADFRVVIGAVHLKDWALRLVVPETPRSPRTVVRALLTRDSVRLAGRDQADGDNLRLAFRMKAGRDGISLDELNVSLDGLQASLSAPFGFSYATGSFDEAARIRVDADLTRQPWVAATGAVRAEVDVFPRGVTAAELTFTASGEGLVVAGVPVARFRTAGSFAHPNLHWEAAEIQLDESSRITAKGSYDVRSGEVRGSARFSLAPAWLAVFKLPVAFEDVLGGEVELSGPVGNIAHSGVMERVPFTVGGLPRFTAALRWAGQGTEQVSVDAEIESERGGHAAVGLAAARDAVAGLVAVDVEQLELSGGDLPPLRLLQPVKVVVETDGSLRVASVSPVELASERTQLSGSYNLDTGIGSISGAGLDPRLLEPWTNGNLPGIIVDDFAVLVRAFSPELAASFRLTVHGTDALVDELAFRMEGSLDSNGINLRVIEGTIESRSFLSGTVAIPVRIHPLQLQGAAPYSLIPGGALGGNLSAGLSDPLIRELGESPLLQLIQGASLEMRLDGTLENPVARLEMQLGQLDVLHLLDARFAGYVFEDIRLTLDVDPEMVELRDFHTGLRGGQLEGGGRVATGELRQMVDSRTFDWEQLLGAANLQVRLSDFRASEFSSLLPPYLRPKGRLAGNLGIEPGFRASGDLELTGFSLRPTLYSQTIEQIRLLLQIEDTRLSITDASAALGDSQVELAGYLDLNDFVEPLFSLQLTGTRTPLVRTTDLLLLADIDLSLDHPEVASPTELSGVLTVRDSVLLMDIDPLAARTAGGAMPAPPFFSIQTEPYAGWNLDVEITGEDALRFKSQLASGLFSIRADLTGTLAQPVWIGEIRTSSADILFPSTRLSVSRGELFITRAQQDRLQLDINAIGRVASHIISMEIGGTAAQPHVEFASTPALPNARIFQLLTTGSLTNSGAGSIGLFLGRGLLGPSTGRQALLDRLTLEFGKDVSRSGSETVDIYFDLTERFRLHGEYDKYDEHNLDLEWEVFSR